MVRHAAIKTVLAGAIVFWLAPGTAGISQVPKASGWGARVMMEPVIIAHGGFTALCNPRAAQRAGWGVDQIEKMVKPTQAQRVALADLRAKAAEAIDLSSAACPRAIPQGSRERLAFVEQRLASMLHATKILTASFDTFYTSLSEEQKARVDAGPSRWRWRN